MTRKSPPADKRAEEEVEVVLPAKTLRHVVTDDGRKGGPQIDMDAIQRAEKALDKLSVSFGMWMGEEIDTLRDAHAAAVAEDMKGEARDAFFRAAHDLRGEAATLGFPLVGQVAGSLADLLSMLPPNLEISPGLVDGHIQAINAMIREDARGDDNKTAIALANCLREASGQLLEAHGALDNDIGSSAETDAA
ncbi:MAG: Hpt domain-containing protein [Rhodobiaceae bacterium]|nr:Hpt domain-containing protein [Rhodobiaceae bacterium]MCC0042354.1 Hpt domain-containing protein [Rhodobiaceae bacterium]MCC0054118.1 Hpt domain-containing protein [Rhodobiaceae bacterium]